MQVKENAAFTKDYYDPQKRYIGNACRCSSWMAPPASAWQWISRSGIASGAPKGCRVLVKKFESSVCCALPGQADRIDQGDVSGSKGANGHAGQRLRAKLVTAQ